MPEFAKLSRAEMKNILGGTAQPPSNCTNECSSTSACLTGSICVTETCPDDKNFVHYICVRE